MWQEGSEEKGTCARQAEERGLGYGECNGSHKSRLIKERTWPARA